MTDGKNNPNEIPEDDWAMSEPDSDLAGKELEIDLPPENREEDVQENVSNLYDPLETGDLEGWDISEETAPAVEPEPPVNQSSPRFQTPANAIEIIEPEKPYIPPENWEMKPASPQDGWKMPEPEFRSSDGKTNHDAEPLSTEINASPDLPPEVDENLSDIYAPPDTEESFDEMPGDIELTEPEDEVLETEDFADIPELETEPAEPTSQAPPKKRRRKTFIFLTVIFLLILIFAIGLLGVAYFFYFDQLKTFLGI